MPRRLTFWLCAALFLISRESRALVHVVRPGETLARIAERVYGSASRERVLVGANALDVQAARRSRLECVWRFPPRCITP